MESDKTVFDKDMVSLRDVITPVITTHGRKKATEEVYTQVFTEPTNRGE